MRARGLAVLAPILALLALLGACREDSQTQVAPPVRPVLSVVAAVHTTDTLGPFVGSIQPRYKTDLGFRIFGRMVARFVDVGATVTKGQEIAALDPAVQALAVRSAEASLANAEAQFANAQAEEARQKDLVLRNITPQAQYDLTRRNLETTTANLTRARASLRKAKDALGYTRLDADFDGVITARYAEPGQVLTAGQKVVTLARPEVREVVIAVPDKLAEQLAHTSDFTITVNLDRVSMKAAGIRAIDPIADPNTRTRNVYLTLNDPPEVFRLGATVSVTFSRPVAAHVDLPATALLEKDGKAFVWVV
jgi:RND family efflux transporter MFP subunit